MEYFSDFTEYRSWRRLLEFAQKVNRVIFTHAQHRHHASLYFSNISMVAVRSKSNNQVSISLDVLIKIDA